MKNVILITSEKMGSGDDALGKKLISTFLKKVWAKEDKPSHIILYNSGVKLMTKKAGCLDALHALEAKGVDILGCGTCIDTFDIKDSVEIGAISNMEEIVDVLFEAEKVITI